MGLLTRLATHELPSGCFRPRSCFRVDAWYTGLGLRVPVCLAVAPVTPWGSSYLNSRVVGYRIYG